MTMNHLQAHTTFGVVAHVRRRTSRCGDAHAEMCDGGARLEGTSA